MAGNKFRCDGSHSRLIHFLSGPGFSRRNFFRLAGSGLTGYYFSRVLRPIDVLAQSKLQTAGTAKNCIFVFLAGAPSHVDLFDFKEDSDVGRPASANLAPQSYNGVKLSRTLLPTLSDALGDLVILRSVQAKALAHQLAQAWAQIGRSPTGALGNVSPNIGAVVALEAEARRKPTDVLPGFIAFNSSFLVGSGYFSSKYSPFQVTPAATGLAELSHPDGQTLFNEMWQLVQDIDAPLRVNSTIGKAGADMAEFYNSAVRLMGSADAKAAFQYSSTDLTRYEPPAGAASGGRYGVDSSFAGACLAARNLLKANIGTRFISITLDGWDMHSNIYGANNSLLTLAPTLDYGLGNLIKDLKATSSPENAGKSLLDDTLIVVQGEFGRTPTFNDQDGRDHFTRQFSVMAGGGVAGGRVIGQTDKIGNLALDYGWHAKRDIRNEDIFATIYSALGIDYTTVRFDDPIGRGFEYVPGSKDGDYEPITEVFASFARGRTRRVI